MIKRQNCLLFVLVLLSVFLLVSCIIDSGSRFKYVTVTFDSNGGTPIARQIVVEGCTAVKPVDPVFETHEFIGWFDEESMLYDFASPVNSNITLKANWTAASKVQQAATASEISFENKVQNKDASFSIQITPDGGKNDLTTITIPSGAITTDSKEDSMSSKMTIISYAVEIAPAKFTVEGDKIVVAGIDCKLIITENGKERTVEDFNGQKVKVSTYTLKGLKKPNVSYDGDKSQPTDVTYDSATGLLTFCTTHFSTFLVTSESVAYVKETKLAYDTLSAAITAAKSAETVGLLKPVEIKDTAVSINNKDLILDLNGQTLTASLTVTGKAAVTITNGVLIGAIKAEGGTGDAYIYINDGEFKSCAFSAVDDKSHIVIKGGTFHVDPSAYVAEGYYAVKNSGTTATWTVLLAPQPDSNNVFKVTSEAELDAILETFNSGNSSFANKNYTIELPGGTFGGVKSGDKYIAKVYVLKQYAKWNNDYNSRDNLQGVLDSHRGLTIVGSSDPENRTDFKGIFVIVGNGNSNDYCYDDNVKTVIQNIDFDYTDVVGQSGALDDIVDNEGKYFPIVVCAAASNINIEGCTFKNTERIKIGFSANAVIPKEFYDENGKVRYLSGYGFFTTIKNCKFEDVNAVADGYPKGASDEQKGYYKEALVLDNITASGLTSGFVNIQSGSNVMDTVIKNCTASGSAGYGVRVQASGGKVIIKDSTITITGESHYFLAFKKNENITITLENVAVGSGGSTEINSLTSGNTVEIIAPTSGVTDNTPISFTLTGSNPASLTDYRKPE